MIQKILAFLPLPIFVPMALIAADVGSDRQPQGAGPISQESPIAAPVQDESPASKKKILDLVRRGVVVIDVKTYASIDSEKRSAWTGSGFIVHIDPQEDYAIIATNRHVVGDMTVSTYTVKFSNGTTATAQLLYFDPLFDFAFLKIEKAKLPKDAVALELSEKPLEVNTSVYTMGNSAKDEFSTYKCTLFSLYEMLGPFAEQSVKFAGLTVPGASGSPGFDESGKVVLIVYGGKFTSGAGLPITYVSDALSALKQKKQPSRRSLGICPQYTSLEDLVKVGLLPVSAMQEYLNAFPDANNKVLMINSRMAGSEASQVFEPGDILWKIGDKLIGPKVYDLDKIVNAMGQNETVTLAFYRKGELKEAKVKTYPLTLTSAQHMIAFADAAWVQNGEFVRLFLGHEKEGIFMLGVGQTSPFKSLFNADLSSFFMDTRVIQVTELDGKPLKNLDDLVSLIPSLMQKREFTVKYIDFMGMVGLGMFSPADRKERLAVVTYESKFDSPKYYTFNTKKNEWDTVDLSGGSKPVINNGKPFAAEADVSAGAPGMSMVNPLSKP